MRRSTVPGALGTFVGALSVSTASAVTLTPTSDARTLSVTVTAACEGTTSDEQAAAPYEPWQAYAETTQSCDGEATMASAISLQQSQLYPNGIFGWCVAATSGAGPAGVEARAESAVEIGFEVDGAARLGVWLAFEPHAGPPGSTFGTLEVARGAGAVLASADHVGDGSYGLVWFVYASLIEAGDYVVRAAAVSDPGGPALEFSPGDIGVSLFLDVVRIGDVDADGNVGFADLSSLLADWGACPPDVPCPADINGDGVVGFADLSLTLNHWGPAR